MKITPKNWAEFQHYKNRSPAWIKLHKKMLDDYEYHCLPVASKALAPYLWLLASEYHDGVIDAPPDKIAFRLRMTQDDFDEALKPLITSGFFDVYDDASNVLAERYQDACLEKRREREEKEREERVETKTRSARFTPPTIEEVILYCRERNSVVDPQRWHDHYTANGWKVGGKTPMKDWQAAVRTWEARERKTTTAERPAWMD